MSKRPLNDTVAGVVRDTRPGQVLFDFGACDGGTARQLALWAPRQTPIYAWECDPRNVEMIRKARMPRNVELIDWAVGAADGVGLLHLSESDTAKGPGGIWSVSSTMRKPKRHLEIYPWVQYRRTHPVRVVSLDTFWRDRGLKSCRLIWADIEGSEIDLIHGGREAFARTEFFFTEKWVEEMYEGMATRQGILDALPGWEIVDEWECDMLLRNTKVVA